jgi:DNA repair protein RecN (Recombination protein N)
MEAEQALERMAGVSGDLDALREELTECRCQAQDAADAARDLRSGFDFEPGELDQLEGRLDQLYRLKKKYGGSVEEMLDYLDKCRTELDQIQFADDTLLRLEGERAKALKVAQELARELSQVRQTAGKALEERIQTELAQLDMPKVRFRVDFSPVEGDAGLNADGMDQVRFLMSANVGEDLKPIQKIASGGELARIMLALKNVLAENDDISTLVFDEVDTGVSGRAAQKVAEKLAQVARHKQVLCVTHLPQIAAMADVHFSVEKGERDGRTYTAVEALDRARRQKELARLTSGDHVTQAALDSAGELLDGAAAYRAGLSRKTV